MRNVCVCTINNYVLHETIICIIIIHIRLGGLVLTLLLHLFLFSFSIVLFILQYVFFSKRKQISYIKQMQDQFVEVFHKDAETSKSIMNNVLEDIKSSERNISSISQKVELERNFIENNAAKTQKYQERIEQYQQQQDVLQELYRNSNIAIKQLHDILYKSKDALMDYDMRKEEFEKTKMDIATVNGDIEEKLQSTLKHITVGIQHAESTVEAMGHTVEQKINSSLHSFNKILHDTFTSKSTTVSDTLHGIVLTHKEYLEQQSKAIEERIQSFKQSVQSDITHFNGISEEKRKELLAEAETTTTFIQQFLHQKQEHLEQDYRQWYNSYAKKFDELYTKVDGLGNSIDVVKQKNNAEIESMGQEIKKMSLYVQNESKGFMKQLQHSKRELQGVYHRSRELDTIVRNNFESEKEMRISMLRKLWEEHKNTLEKNNTISINDFNDYVAKEKQKFGTYIQNEHKGLDTLKAQAITGFNDRLQMFEQEFDKIITQKKNIFLQFDISSKHFNEEKNKYVQAMQKKLEEQKIENKKKLEDLDINCDMVLIGLQAKVEQLQQGYDDSFHSFQNELQTLKDTRQKEQEDILNKYNDVFISFQHEQDEKYKQFKQKTVLFFQELDAVQEKEQKDMHVQYQALLAEYKHEHDNKYKSMLEVLDKEYDTMLEHIKQSQSAEVQHAVEKYNSKIDELLSGYKDALAEYKERLEILKIHQQSDQDTVIASFKEAIDSLKIESQKQLLDHQNTIETVESSYNETLMKYSSAQQGLHSEYDKTLRDYQQYIQNLKDTTDDMKAKSDMEVNGIRENFVALVENYQDNTTHLLDEHKQMLHEKEKDIDGIIKRKEREYSSLCESIKKQVEGYTIHLSAFKDDQCKKVDSNIAIIKGDFKKKLQQYSDELHSMEQEHRKVKDSFGVQLTTFQKEHEILLAKSTKAIGVFGQQQETLQKEYEEQLTHLLSSINEKTQKNFDIKIKNLEDNFEQKLSDTSTTFEQNLYTLKKSEANYLKTAKTNLSKFDAQMKKIEKTIKNKEVQLVQNIKDLEIEHKKYTVMIERDQQQQEQVRVFQSMLDEKIEKLDKQTKQVMDKSSITDTLLKKINSIEVKTKEVKSEMVEVNDSFHKVIKVRKEVELFSTSLTQSDNKNKQLFHKLESQNEKMQSFQERSYKIQELQNEVYNTMHDIEEKNTTLQSKWQELDTITASIRDLDSLTSELKQEYKDISDDVGNVKNQYKDIKDIKQQVHETKLLFPKVEEQLKKVTMHRKGLIQDINSLSQLHETTESKITLIHELEPMLKRYAGSRGLLDKKQNNREMSEAEREKLIINLHRKQGYSEEQIAQVAKTTVNEVRYVIDNALV